MLNTVFGRTAVEILCPYDADALDAATIADASRTHPTVISAAGRRTSASYSDPTSLYDGGEPLLAVAPETAMVVPVRPGELALLRQAVREFAAQVDVAADRTRDLVIAVNELATNTLMYSGGFGTLRMWRAQQSAICEIADAGHLTDPLAGRRRPAEDAIRGRGLWMVNQLCDLVQWRSTAQGTTTRLHIDLVSG